MTFRGTHLYVNGPEIQGVFGVTSLPLTTVAHIVSYLDGDVASLARLCRTSRSLYYMAVPHLWGAVVLKSYNSIRYRDDVPEGFGSASPFSMGLNALVTRNVSSLVRSLTLEGDFAGSELHEYSRAGRVSEYGMILNIAVCAAIDKCTHLEKFRWDLNTRLQPNVYTSLARLSHLKELWLSFPSTRTPHPTSDLPALPHLKSFTMTNYDPLCHPDDISTLLLHADKLEVLRMHFSPRMREQGEPSVFITHLFRKNIAAKKKLKLKKMGIYNLLANMDASECLHAVDSTTCEDFTALNSFGMDEDKSHSNPSTTYFIDRTWLIPMDKMQEPKPKALRLDQLHKRHALDLQRASGLERLYLVNARHRSEGTNGFNPSTPNSAEDSPQVPPSNMCSSSSGRSSRITPTSSTNLRDLYMDNICNICGPTLRHLILPARWPLPQALTARLIRSAPNLTQLSAAIMCTELGVMRLLVPFLTRLWAIRILSPTPESPEGIKANAEFSRFVNYFDEHHQKKLGEELAGPSDDGGTSDFPRLKYVGLGPKIWQIGEMMEEVVKVPVLPNAVSVDMHNGTDQIMQHNMPSWDGMTVANGEENSVSNSDWTEEIRYRRRIIRITEDDVRHVEIWRMDSLDVI